MPEYQGMDGWRRNLAKLKHEGQWVWWALTRTIAEDAKKPHRVVHNYVDLFVETGEASPYFMGHLHALLYPVLVGAIIYLW